MKKYWEFWLDERERSVRMSYIVLVLIGVIALLSFSLYKLYTAPKPVYVIMAKQESGIVFPNQYTKPVLQDFVEKYLTLTYSYTPNTVRDSLQMASYFVSPKLYTSVKYDFESRIKYSIQQNISSSIYFYRDSFKYKKIGEGVWEAQENALIKQYFGTNLIKKKVQFDITIKRGSPTKENPFGLYVYSLVANEVKGGE